MKLFGFEIYPREVTPSPTPRHTAPPPPKPVTHTGYNVEMINGSLVVQGGTMEVRRDSNVMVDAQHQIGVDLTTKGVDGTRSKATIVPHTWQGDDGELHGVVTIKRDADGALCIQHARHAIKDEGSALTVNKTECLGRNEIRIDRRDGTAYVGSIPTVQ